MILLTGGTGFLGGHLLYHLLKDGQTVVATKRKSSNLNMLNRIFSYYTGEADRYLNSVQWIDIDLLNYSEVYHALHSVEKVYHAAALVSYDPKDKDLLYENNVIGTQNLVNACLEHQIGKFCYVSSISALGETGDGSLINEKTYWSEEDGNSGYSVSKYNAELEVWRGINEGLNAFIINPSVILGYGDPDKGSSALFSTIFKGFSYYTLGSSGFVDVKDVCRIMIGLDQLNISGKNFIVSAENIVYKDIFESIAASMGVKAPHKYATPVLTNLAWKTEYLRSKLLGKRPLITRESANTSHKTLKYSDDKLQECLPYKYEPIDKLINELGQLFREEFVKK